jgi:Asp-tRNA(Asn)/Glu-tRNA(Gln) amidotransferase C subunit
MSVQSTVKVNKTLQQKLDKANGSIEEAIKDQLEHIANYAVAISPVDTGAYVESFSMIPAGQGGGRMKSRSARSDSVKEGEAKRETFASKARKNLYGDINKFNLETSDKITLINRSTHARDVEDTYGYGVFAKVRNKFG